MSPETAREVERTRPDWNPPARLAHDPVRRPPFLLMSEPRISTAALLNQSDPGQPTIRATHRSAAASSSRVRTSSSTSCVWAADTEKSVWKYTPRSIARVKNARASEGSRRRMSP
jgi:hypothetical protein